MRGPILAFLVFLAPGLNQAALAQGVATGKPLAAPPARIDGLVLPPDYRMGPDDILSIVFWRDKDLSADVVVRPDGKISLPLLNDVVAAGLTPEELRARVAEEARRYIADPHVTVVVKEIHSRKVFITGQVEKPGVYALTSPMTVIQLIALAGGLKEYANRTGILVVRTEPRGQVAYKFNYREVLKRKKLWQNIELKPGDSVVVP